MISQKAKSAEISELRKKVAEVKARNAELLKQIMEEIRRIPGVIILRMLSLRSESRN